MRLPAIVLYAMVVVPLIRMPPASSAAPHVLLLPLIVLFVRWVTELVSMPPA